MTDHRTKSHDHQGRHKKDGGKDKRGQASFVEANPLAVVIGGVAFGAVAGALIPRSKKEKELLAPLGRQIHARARNAIDAAREVGGEELKTLGLSKSAAQTQARSFVDGIGQALANVGQAAAKSAANSPD